jgi:hypothetical protein
MTQPTFQLLRGILSNALELLRVETTLAGVELKESARAASFALATLIAGLVLWAGGLIILLIAAGYFLMRLGVPPDLSFLLVAAAALLIGCGLLMAGTRSLSFSRLVPHKSLAQISAVFGGR